MRTRHFQNAKREGIKITGLTSYDMLTARIFDEAGIDFLLVGDSAGNTVFGRDTTLPVTVDELIPLTRAVVRACKRALVVADMPFGSYQESPAQAFASGPMVCSDSSGPGVSVSLSAQSANATTLSRS